MKIAAPDRHHITQLRTLWKSAFGDEDAFLDAFFSTAYSPARCLCILDEDQVLAALYWFDASCENHKFAYLYAVATDPAHRGKGLCRRLMDATAQHLTVQGYSGLILVPQKEPLRRMYRKMGYTDCGSVSTFTAPPEDLPLSLRRLTAAEYALRRRKLLPPAGVIQEEESLFFLASYALFFEGDDWLAALTIEEGKLVCHELLGNPDAAYALVAAFGCGEGRFRIPGQDQPFAQYRKLIPTCPEPGYFGLAFD
jgi:ribosomal protein S18 acetylase RimI-like enzyme